MDELAITNSITFAMPKPYLWLQLQICSDAGRGLMKVKGVTADQMECEMANDLSEHRIDGRASRCITSSSNS